MNSVCELRRELIKSGELTQTTNLLLELLERYEDRIEELEKEAELNSLSDEFDALQSQVNGLDDDTLSYSDKDELQNEIHKLNNKIDNLRITSDD